MKIKKHEEQYILIPNKKYLLCDIETGELHESIPFDYEVDIDEARLYFTEVRKSK